MCEKYGQWAVIPGLTGYAASPSGEIVNLRTRKILSQRRGNSGMMQVSIGRSTRMVHDLVARAFFGHPVGPGFRVKHCNLDPSDNRPDNLAWSGRPLTLSQTARQLPKMPDFLASEYVRVVAAHAEIDELMQP